MIKVQCELCGEYITKNNIKKHLRRHQSHPETFTTQGHNTSGIILETCTCSFCGKSFKNRRAVTQHTIRCSLNPNKIKISNDAFKQFYKKGATPWNKGLSIDYVPDDEPIKDNRES